MTEFISILHVLIHYFNHKCRIVSAAIAEGEEVYLTTICKEA